VGVSSSDDILFEQRGAAGLVTLNRPKALNALTRAMALALHEQLRRWAGDPAVTRVVVTAAGGRAFSAGGDLRDVYELGRAGRYDEALGFWRDEYRLNAAIKHFPKPYVALIDGIVMGGGVGVSVHGSHRIAGDRFLFAMPEVGIGFFPDVGATFFLPRLPGKLGTYCALTGERLGADDAVAAGVATHRVNSAHFPNLLAALCEPAPVDAVVAEFAMPAGEGPRMQQRTAIDHLLSGTSIEEILDECDRQSAGQSVHAGFAESTAAMIRGKSPLSLKVALSQMRLGISLSFEACLQTEFRIVSRVIRGRDFYEGVRAVIVDKDNRPQWEPASLAAISRADVERHFAPLPDGDLVL
jgi:enoyl-CoA hydratase